jgi:hypothetical protein
MTPFAQGTMVDAFQLYSVTANGYQGFQRSVLHFILKDTVQCGFNVRLVFKSDPIQLSDTEQSVIDTHWPHFVREAMYCLMTAGMVVVQAAGDRGAKVPRVVPFDYVNVYFVETASVQRQYWVEDRGSGEIGTTRAVMDVLLFVLDQPDAAGRLTSNGAALLDIQQRQARMMNNHDEADFTRTHPTWVFGTEGRNAVGRSSPNDHDEFVVGETRRAANAALQAVNTREYNELERMEMRMREQHARVMSAIENDPSQAPLPPGARMPPFARRFMLSVNQSLEVAPVPQLNTYLIQEREQAERNVMEHYGVPLSMMDATKGGSRHASAQSNLDAREWMTTVMTHQRMLAEFVRETYMFVNVDMLDAYVRLFTHVALEDTERALSKAATASEPKPKPKPRSPASKARAAAKTRSPAASDSGESSDADADADADAETEGAGRKRQRRKRPASAASSSDSESDAEAAIEAVPEHPAVFTNDDGDKQIGESVASMERAAQLLSVTTKTVEALMRAEIKIDVTFNMNLAVATEDLSKAHEDGMIAHDVCAEMTGIVLGLPKSSMLIGEAECIADARFRKRIKDILEPEPKPAAKPAPKPAAKPAPAKPAAAKKKPKSGDSDTDASTDAHTDGSDGPSRKRTTRSKSKAKAAKRASKPAAGTAASKEERTIDVNININK